LPEGPIGVQANFNGIWIREGCQKNLSEVLPQLLQLPLQRSIARHDSELYEQLRCNARKRFSLAEVILTIASLGGLAVGDLE
jgi:hypothetical protein